MKSIIITSLILIAIAAFALLNYNPTQRRQRMLDDHTKVQLMCIDAAATEFYRMNQTWPSSIEEIAKTDPQGNIQMLKGATNDPWGHSFIFEPFDPKRGHGCIVSYGSDGLPGGGDSARDLVFAFAEDQGKNLRITKTLR